MPSMVIHNLMENMVLRVVSQICDEDEVSDAPRYGTQPECRMDAACFVLNRIPQRYVSSARGQAHVDESLRKDQQLQIDIVALAHEGLRRVTTTRRAFYDGETTQSPVLDGPGIYFPVIKGRLLHALTFDLVSDIAVELRSNGELVSMIDTRWENPYAVVGNAPGTYLFWPKPEPDETPGTARMFDLEIQVQDEKFEPFHHYFRLELAPAHRVPDALEFAREHRLPDLYLIPI